MGTTEVTEGTAGPFMSPVEVARLVGVNARTVIRWADKGILPLAHRTAGGHRRFRKTDVDAYLARREVPPAE